MLVLTTTGRRTGRPRQTPLLYVEDGPDLAVVASNYGSDLAPAWYLNLVDRPQARAQLGGERRAVRARVATAREASRLWPMAIAAYPGYQGYRWKANREIPIVILEPAAPVS
jgi:deazaflavin-dependent oxidoreductase (nitroreductase family)